MAFHAMTMLAAAFLQPGLAAAGAGLAGVPILIHLLNRRRFRRIIWAAMDWLLAAQRKNARRIRIEQLLLLLIRCLIMLLIALALAQPILGALFGQARAVRLIVLDDSYSMDHGGGDSPFARAKEAAVKLVDLFDSGDAISVVLAGSPARKLIDQPSYDRKAIKEAISELKPTARSTDLAGAFALAQDILGKLDDRTGKQVVVVSDRSRSAWLPAGTSGAAPGADLGAELAALAKMATIGMVDVGPADAWNLAVTNLTAQYATTGSEQKVNVIATVANLGRNEQQGLKIRFTLDSARQAGRPASWDVDVPDVAAGKRVEVSGDLPVADPGFHNIRAKLILPGSAELPDDRLAIDDERVLSLLVRRWINVMLVDGQPGANAGASETFWLRCALAPVTQVGPAGVEELKSYTFMPRVERALRPAPGWLSDVDLVVLANVDLLATADVQKVAAELTQFVARGGGLMVFMGTQTDSAMALDLYNSLFYRDGAGPLPARLVAAVGNARERTEGELLVLADPNHVVLKDLKAKKDPLQSPQFFRHVKAELKRDSGATVLLGYTGGDPAVIVRNFGDGKVALVTTSADGDWNTLCSKVDYVPLFNQLAYFLTPAADLSRNLLVGGSLAEALTADQARTEAELKLVAPVPLNANRTAFSKRLVPEARPQSDASATTGNAELDALLGPQTDRRRFMVRAANLIEPGLYELQVADVTPEPGLDGRVPPADRLEHQSRFHYAVNAPADAESDVRALSDEELKSVLGPGPKVLKPEELDQSKASLLGGTDVSHWLLYAVLALCLLETFLAQRFGHFRE